MFWNFIENDDWQDKLMLWDNDLSLSSKENHIKALRYIEYKLSKLNQDIQIEKLFSDVDDYEKSFILDFIIILNDINLEVNNKNLEELLKYWIFNVKVSQLKLSIEEILLGLNKSGWELYFNFIPYNKFIESCNLLIKSIDNYKLPKEVNKDTFWVKKLIKKILKIKS
jgi:hypothetical protein